MLVFIDSSIVHPGIAISRGATLYDTTCLSIPADKTVNKQKIKFSDIQRLKTQLDMIYAMMPANTLIDAVFIETPGFRAQDRSSKISIQQLYHTVGFLAGYFTCQGIPVFELAPNKWKGGKKKEATIWEIDRIYPNVKKRLTQLKISEKLQSNAYDAVGIFHHVCSQPEYFKFTRGI